MIRVEHLRACPRHRDSLWLDLRDGATLADAFAASGWDAAPAAVFGERARADRPLENGDRVEVLRPLIADPKEARRRRARGARG